MTPEAAQEAAALLRAARREVRTIDNLPEALRPSSVEEGYAVQRAFVAGNSAEDPPLETAGFKVGCTSQRAQGLLGVEEPFYGQVAARALYDSPARLKAGSYAFRLVEAEFALRLARDLPPREAPYEEAEVAEAVATVHPAYELVCSAYGESWMGKGAPSIIADNAVQSALVLGPGKLPGELPPLEEIPVTLKVNGALHSQGEGRKAMGGPLKVLTWLANRLRGGPPAPPLLAGDVITTGLVVEIALLAAGDEAVADYGPLGEVVLRFVD